MEQTYQEELMSKAIKIADEQHQMLRLLNLNADNPTTSDLEFADRMIRLRAEEGDEAFQRKLVAMFSEPQPTLRNVMRELKEIREKLDWLAGELRPG